MLREIIAHKRKEVAEQKRSHPPGMLKKQISDSSAPLDFKKALQEKPGTDDLVRIIAEIKKASPSRGYFSSSFLKKNTVSDIAELYERAGAAAISVLTDKKYFAGCMEDLKAAKQNTDLPVLRKDFIIDEYQVYEARAAGADAVLLIASQFSISELRNLLNLVHDLNMSALVEVGAGQDLTSALEAGAKIIGINNRNLETMQIDLKQTVTLAKSVPEEIVLVSESGIETGKQVRMLYEKAGISAVLVGSSLVNAADPFDKIRELTEGEK